MRSILTIGPNFRDHLYSTDAAGNVSESTTVTVVVVVTAPTINIAALSDPSNGVYTASITLSEASTDFTVSDLSLGNATATLTGSGTGYTATLTPNADGLVKLWVEAASFTDASGNDNTTSNEVSTTFDSTAPTVTISGVPTSSSGTTPFDLMVTFSESVFGFVLGDVGTTNATATLVTGSGDSYVVTITPSGSGDISVWIPGSVAADAAGNGNTASAIAAVTDRTIEVTQEQITGFLSARSTNLLASQPDLKRFLLSQTGGGLDANVTKCVASFDGAYDA